MNSVGKEKENIIVPQMLIHNKLCWYDNFVVCRLQFFIFLFFFFLTNFDILL